MINDVELESSFTEPRPDCPRPELWHAYDGYATEVEVTELVVAMVRALQPEFVVETGTHTACTATALVEALERNGHGHLVTLEVDLELAIDAVKKFHGYDCWVTPLHQDSLTYEPDQSIDLLWLDSATYLPGTEQSMRVAEYHHFRPYLSDRAVVMIHDTGPHRPIRDELDMIDNLDIVHLPTPRGVSIGRPR